MERERAPLGIVRGSFVQVMTPHFAEMEEQKRHRAILALWHASASRLSLIYYPMVAILVAFAPEAFALLLPDAYAPGIVIFRIFALIMVGDALGGIEALLKAFAQNRFILWTQRTVPYRPAKDNLLAVTRRVERVLAAFTFLLCDKRQQVQQPPPSVRGG